MNIKTLCSGGESYSGNAYRDGTIASRGCLPTSMAIIASGLKPELNYTPEDTAGQIWQRYGNGWFENIEPYMDSLGLPVEDFKYDVSAQEIQNQLRAGKVLIVYVEYSVFYDNHYVAVVDINENGQVLVLNPSKTSDESGGSGWYDASEFTLGSNLMISVDSGKVGTAGGGSNTTDGNDTKLGYQAVVATWTQIDKSTELNNSPHAEDACANLGITIENGTTYTMSTTTIDYESMVEPYTLSFDLLWTFLVLGQSKGFVMDWADLAYNSEIEVSVYDNLTTTTNIDDWHYIEETDVKVNGYVNYDMGGGKSRFRRVDHEHIYENGDTSVKKEDGHINKTVVTQQNTVVAELTKAHTWIADYDNYYTYNNEGESVQTGQQHRDNYTVVPWTKGSIEDDPCNLIQEKIDEVVESVNSEYKAIAEENSKARMRELYDTIGDLGDTAVNMEQPQSISAADVNTSNVDLQKQINHVEIVDNTTNKVAIRKYTAGVPTFVIKDSETQGTTIGGSNNSEIVGDTIEEKVWWAVQNAGYSKEAAAGVMGNIYAESGFRTNSLESGYSYDTIMNNPNLGLGLAGWTYQPWKEELINFAKSRGKDWTDEDIQVEFLISGITPPSGVAGVSGYWMSDREGCTIEAFKNASTPEDAAYQFCWVYENPSKMYAHVDTRTSKAREYYNKYKDYEEPAGKIVENLDNFLFIGDSRYAEGGPLNAAIKSIGNNITIYGVGSSTIQEWLDVANNNGAGTIRGTNVNITGNYSGISIQLGANSVLANVDGATSQMKNFINKLKEFHPNTPIFVNSCLGVNANANSSGYSWNVTDMQNCINGFNSKIKEYCNSTDNVYYVDISNGLMDTSGLVKSEYESDGLHMSSSEGAKIFVENLQNGAIGKGTTTKTRRKTSSENFVTLFNKPKYRQNRNNILSATEWLFEFMEKNDKLSNMVDLIKYLLYKATGINFGATDIEQIWQEYLNSFNSIGAEGGLSGISGVPGQVYDFLLQKGVPPVGAAAVMGNIENESGFNPSAVNEIGCSGLCQWYQGRLDNLKRFAASKGTDWTDVNTQMEYLWKELNESYPKVKSAIMNAKSEVDLEKATWYWGAHFEVYDSAKEVGYDTSKNWPEEKERYEAAKKWYNEWKTHHTSGGGLASGGITTDAEAEALTETFNQMLNTRVHRGDSAYQSGPFPSYWYNQLEPFQCTWWANGRASMYLDQHGTKYKAYPTAWGDGGDYYSVNVEGGWFNYGSTPKPNSIISWSDGSYGHVAYVEGVSSDGIYISHAGSGRSWMGVQKIPLNGSIWDGYYLNGYIYLDEPK